MWIEKAVRAEELEFDACWFGEHRFNDYVISAPQIMLAAVASRTKHNRLDVAVSLLSIRIPCA